MRAHLLELVTLWRDGHHNWRSQPRVSPPNLDAAVVALRKVALSVAGPSRQHREREVPTPKLVVLTQGASNLLDAVCVDGDSFQNVLLREPRPTERRYSAKAKTIGPRQIEGQCAALTLM